MDEGWSGYVLNPSPASPNLTIFPISRAYTNVNRLAGSSVGLDAMKRWDLFMAVPGQRPSLVFWNCLVETCESVFFLVWIFSWWNFSIWCKMHLV